MPDMRLFLRKSTVYRMLLWAVILLGLLDWLVYGKGMSLLQPLNRPERTAVLQAWQEFGPERTGVVFVGDSRTGTAFIPDVVDEELRAAGHSLASYNLAGTGSTLPSDAGVVDHLFRVGARPKLIVLGVGERQTGLTDMAGFQRNESNPRLACHLFRAEPSWQNVCTMGSALLRGPRVMLQLPLQLLPHYRNRLANTKRSKGIGYIYSPGAPAGETAPLVDEAAEGDDREQVVARLRDILGTPFERDRTIEAAIADIAASARGHDCRLVVLNTPATRLRTAIEEEYGYSEYLAWLRNFAAEWSARFVDLNSPPWLPPDSDFGDTHHLSAAGAERFSRLVTQRILIPELEAIGE